MDNYDDEEMSYYHYDDEEMSYYHSCDTPTKEELYFYDWFKNNPRATNSEVASRDRNLSPHSFVCKTSVSMLRELLKIDLSHCEKEHDQSFQKAEAIRLLMEGEDMSHSTGICESPTQGYGRLGHYGYWEHPISQVDIDRTERDESWCLKKGRF